MKNDKRLGLYLCVVSLVATVYFIAWILEKV